MRPMLSLDIPDHIRDEAPEAVRHLRTGPTSSLLEAGQSRDIAAGALAFRRAYRVMFGNIEKMELDAHRDMFDAIVFSDSVERLETPEQSLRAIAPWLRQGACIYAVYRQRNRLADLFRHKPINRLSADKFASIFEQAGYRILKFEPVSTRDTARLLVATLPEQPQL